MHHCPLRNPNLPAGPPPRLPALTRRPRLKIVVKMRSRRANNRVAKRSALKTIRRAPKIIANHSAVRKWTRRVSKTSSAADSRIRAMAGAGRPILRVRKIAAVETILPVKAFIARR